VTYIKGKSIFSGRNLNIGIYEGRIASIEETEERCTDYLSPGFLDIQINGYHGMNYSNPLSLIEIVELVDKIFLSGTTRHLPTIITDSEENILASNHAIVAARKRSSLLEYSLPGIHIEGPFISHVEGARGVHDPAFIRDADYEEFLRWQEAAEGLIKIVTLSPENEKSIDFIRKISRDGVIAAIGHTNASVEMIEEAIDAGAKLSTHLGNGCPAYIPRLHNFIWKQLSDERLSASIIADGYHLPPYVLKSFTHSKGFNKTILISDVAALAGSMPGLYKWGNMDIEIFDDGHMGLHNTSNLAGASYLLNRGIAHLSECTDLSLEECVRCATVNPWNLLGLDGWELEPQIGDVADLCSFRVTPGELSIQRTICFTTDKYIRNEEKS